ncbi:MAG TPA: metallophosphoesterase family protein [Candidatus Binatia bacterium]|nr:metallophosphoesterase family protein [Candidatus Binatia bacterium]
MRLAVLSDIHSNLPALEAVLAAIDGIGGVDGIRVLGDIVGYGPHPDEVVARLRAEDAVAVAGNHDRAAVGGDEIEWFNTDARAAIEWTRGRIGAETSAWLTDLPERLVDGGFTLVHGSPRDPTWEYILDPSIAAANLAAFGTPHALFGHTHLPIAYRRQGIRMREIVPDPGDELALGTSRTMLNPGSVGQPRDGDPDSSWLLLDTDRGLATWHRTPYDRAATQAAMRRVGLPSRLVARLDLGA